MSSRSTPLARTGFGSKPDQEKLSVAHFAAKPKKCRHCRNTFTPVRAMQIVCLDCVVPYVQAQNAKKRAAAIKADRKETRERLAAMKRLPDLIREAQVEFNKFIRARDAEKPCICCGQPLGEGDVGGAYDCGHYRSTGSASHLRFDERNAHAQRKVCNRWGAGRAVDYRLGLIHRLGLAVVEALEADNTPHKWTREELIAIKETYRAKARALKAEKEAA